MFRHSDTIPIDNCERGRVYLIRARNLKVAIYDGNKGFIGIRTKFGDRYLFTEFHWDQGEPYGTACPLEEYQDCLPEGIELTTTLGTIDKHTRRPVAFDRPVADGGRGWFFVDTDEASEDIRAFDLCNQPLFDWLEGLDS